VGLARIYSCRVKCTSRTLQEDESTMTSPSPQFKIIRIDGTLSLFRSLDPISTPKAVFATGQSVRPEPGRGRTAVCRPVRSFSKVARQVGLEDEDGRHFVVPSGRFLKLPDKSESKTRTDGILSSRPVFSGTCPTHPSEGPSPTVHRPRPSSAVFRSFPLFPAVFRRPWPSPTIPYRNMSQIVGLVVLPNDGRPGNSRTRTDGILSSRPVIFSSCPTSRNERRGRTTFCRPVPSRALGSPPAGPYGGPGRLRTLPASRACLSSSSVRASVLCGLCLVWFSLGFPLHVKIVGQPHLNLTPNRSEC